MNEIIGMSDLAHLAMSLSYVPTDTRVPETLRLAAAEIEKLRADLKDLSTKTETKFLSSDQASAMTERLMDAVFHRDHAHGPYVLPAEKEFILAKSAIELALCGLIPNNSSIKSGE